MSYSSTLHIAIDSTGAEGQLKRLENRLELTDRAGDGAASSVSNVGLEADRMRNMVMRASGVLTGSAAAFGLMARQSSDAAREIKNLSRLAGADVVTFQKMTMASRAFGIEQEQLAQIMLDTQDRIGDFLQTGQGEFADFFEQIAGKSDLTAQALARMAGPEALQAIYNALEDANLSASETVFYMESLASDATRLIPLLKDNGAGFKEVADEAERLGVALSEIEIDQLTALRGEFADLETIISSSTSQIIAEYSGEITSTVDALGDSVSLLADNFDTVQDVAALAAGVFAGRLAGSLGTVTVAKLAATRQAILYQGALARMAGISTTAAISQTALGTASRGAAGALALVGGPLGAAVIAASAIYHFREELGLTQQAIGYTEEELASLRQEMADMDGVQITQTLSQVEDSLFQVGLKAAAAREELAQLRSESGGSGFLGFEGGRVGEEIRGMQAVAEYTEKMTELEQKRAVMQEELTSRTEEGTVAMDDMTVTAARLTGETESLGKAVGETADKTTTLADAYESLLDRITPNRREARQYARDLGVLNLALASGRMTTQQYMQAMGMLQESFQAAQRETENTANAAEDASQRIANSFLSWETVADNTLRRIDDSGQSLWLGLIDGSESALDTVKRGFQQTLAEIAHMLTTQKLTFQVAGMMGLDTTGMPGGGGGLNFGSMGSLYSSATKLPYVGDAISGVGSALGFGSSAAAGGTAVSGGFMSAAATQSASSLYGLAATGGAAPVSLMSSITSGISAAMPWLAGGMLIDNVLGLGIVDGIVGGISDLFGGGKSDPRLNISTRGDAGQFSHESVRTGAFGAVGFSEGTKRSNDLFGSVEAEREWLASVAALDNLTAAAARTPEQLDAMTSAVQNMVLTSGDAQGAIDQLAGRTAAATRVLDAELTQTLLDAGASAEQIAQRFATARNAVDLITAASERLNLQYDANADGALRYADSLVQAYGSVESIAAIQDAYYNAAFSESERLAHQQEDLNAQFAALNVEMPESVEQIRQMIEAQDMNTKAGAQLAYELMALTPALDQVTEAVARQNQAIWDNITNSLEGGYQSSLGRDASADDLYYWMTQIESGAVTLDGALAQISNSVEYHATLWQGFESEIAAAYEQSLGRVANGGEMRYWLQQIEAGAVTLDGALAQIAGSIEAAEFEAAGGAAGLRERAQLNRQLLQAQGNTEALRALELEALHEANRPLQERIWALQDEQEALREAEQNQQRYNQALESAQSAFASFSVGIDDWLAQLRGTEQGLGLPADQLAATSEAFEEQYAKALTGDRDALGSITQYADRFIEAQKGWSASGMLTTSTIDRVSGMLESLPDLLSPEEFLAEEFRNALGDQSDTLSAAFDASTAAAVSALIPKFDAIDTNTDGLLTFSELSAALAGKATDAEIRTLISRVDANGDGMISEQELANYRLGRVASDIGSELEPMFDAIDLNTDGLIDYAEFGRYFSGLATDAELKNIFRTLDADGDGQISRLEAIKGSSQNTDNQTDSLARFFDRAGDLSRGLQVSLSYHQDAKGVQSIGWHVANEIAKMAANGQYLNRFANGGVFSGGVQAFANGGVFTNAIVSSPTLFNMGLMGEEDPEAIVPLSRGAGGRLGIDASGLMRIPEGPLTLPTPDLPLPQFPALGQSDVLQVLQDVRRELVETRKQTQRLQEENNRHLAAANNQRGAAATQQIAATKEGNRMLKKLQDDSRLEAAKR